FLGPNGAGKSTTISMLCTLIRPTAGSAKVAGFDVVAERTQVRRNIGLVFQDTTLDDYLTAEENLRFHAELYGVPRAEVGARLRRSSRRSARTGSPSRPTTTRAPSASWPSASASTRPSARTG